MERDLVARLQDQGHLFANPDFIDREAYRPAYRWMAQQMEKRLRAPLPGCPVWPMWAWIRHEGFEVPLPHERRDEFLVVSAKFQPQDILLSDHDSWHHPLNNYYLADRRAGLVASDQEFGAFYDEIEKAGCPEWMERYPDQVQARIEASWERIFDVAHDDPVVQGTYFSISVENVVSIRPWDSRNMRRKRIIEAPQQDGQFLSPDASTAL